MLAVVVLLIMALVTGCGTDHAGTPDTSVRTGPASATSASATPPVGSRAGAQAYARQLAAGVVLPPGTRPVQLATVPVLVRNPFLLGQPESPTAGTGRIYLAPQSMSKVVSFMMAHAPRGTSSSGAGQETGPGGTTTAEEVDWTGSTLPSGIQTASLRIMIVSRSSGSALIGVYDNVYWFPPRSAAEHIDVHRYQRVTISATLNGPKMHTVTRTFTSAALIGRLAGYLNGLPASANIPVSCPEPAITSQLTFTGAGVPGIAVSVSGCLSDGVTVGGKAQPVLQDQSNWLTTMTEQVLHIKSPHL